MDLATVRDGHRGRHRFTPAHLSRQSLILTIIDCFTRFAVAVPIADQSSESVIAAFLGIYLTLYGTPRRVLTDHGRNFES